MAKKDTNGQMNMFDIFGEDVQMVSLMPDDEFIDDAIGTSFDMGMDDDFPMEVVLPKDISEEEVPKIKEVKEVKEVKAVKEVKEVKAKKETVKDSSTSNYQMLLKDRNKPVMARCFSLSGNSVDGVVAYLDYNRVYVKELGQSAMSYQFQSSKSAVDFYIEKLQYMGKDGVMKMIEGQPIIVATEDIIMEE